LRVYLEPEWLASLPRCLQVDPEAAKRAEKLRKRSEDRRKQAERRKKKVDALVQAREQWQSDRPT
jgi:hypothetical protein